MKSIKTANIMLIALLVIGAAILAFSLFGKETVANVPMTKSLFGIKLSGTKKQKVDTNGKLVFLADGVTPVYE